MGGVVSSIGKAVGSVAKVAVPVAAAYFGGPLAASALGVTSAAGTMAVTGAIGGATAGLTSGGGLEGALKGAALGGALGYAGGSLMPAAGGMLSSEQIASLSGNPEAFLAYQQAGMIPSSMSPSGMLNIEQIQSLTGNPEAFRAYQEAGMIPSGMSMGSTGDIFTAPNLLTGSRLLSTGLNLAGQYAQGRAATVAAGDVANAQIQAARIAAEAAKFKPVGVATRFGQSKFGYDASGNLISAGYELSPEAKAQQDALMAMSGQTLGQYQAAPALVAPMGTAAQSMFNLGQGYLATTPQEQAAKYMAEQQALLAPSRERELAALQARLQAQGRMGLATGGTTTMAPSNPEMEAYYNALRQQDLALAAQATQGGQQYARFGADVIGQGGRTLADMYGVQQAAFLPYQTALGGAQYLESLGQQPMDIGTAIGAKTSTATAQAGQTLLRGQLGAIPYQYEAKAYSPWAGILGGAGGLFRQWGT